MEDLPTHCRIVGTRWPLKGPFQPRPFYDPNEEKFVADYLLSRAEAALESTEALQNGHAQYVASMTGTWGLGLAALLEPCCHFHVSSSTQRFWGCVVPVGVGGHRLELVCPHELVCGTPCKLGRGRYQALGCLCGVAMAQAVCA